MPWTRLAATFSVVGLVACGGGDGGRSLERVESPDTGEPEVWTPDDDTTVALPRVTANCGADTAAFSDIEGERVDVRWCERLSPEAGDWDTGLNLPGSSRCGFFNLVGAVAARGVSDGPYLMYCDSDPGGGLRFLRLDGESGDAVSTLVQVDSCMADAGSGDMVLVDDGALIVWASFEGAWSARLDLEGRIVSGPHPLPGLELAMQMRFMDGTGLVVLVTDQYEDLWSQALDPDGQPVSDPVLVAEDVGSFDVTAVDSDGLVVVCHESDWTVGVGRLDADGELRWGEDVDGASCFSQDEPTIASDGQTGFVIAWDDAGSGEARFFDLDSAQVAQSDLGDGALHPRFVWDGTRYVLADAGGTIAWFDAQGQGLGEWVHPDIAISPGDPGGLRLLVDDDGYLLVLVGHDAYHPSGHIYTYHYIEASVIGVPSP